MNAARGDVLDDRFELTAPLATGGMGEVWRARDPQHQDDIAVKVMRVEFAGQRQFLDRFAAEARNIRDLDHPGIVRLYGYGECDGLAYLAMELVDGQPLSDLLRRRGTLTESETLDLVQQCAEALDVAHRAGVVHRDIKPGNLLLDGDGRVRIIDFGISVGYGQQSITAPGMVMGTAQYLPPEQAMGNTATALGDIYALGVVAYEALAGRRPFTGGNQVDIAVAHVTEQAPDLPGEVSDGVAHLIWDMISKDPATRPATAALVAQRAAALRAGDTVGRRLRPRAGQSEGAAAADPLVPQGPVTRASVVRRAPDTVASRRGVPPRVAVLLAVGLVLLVALVTVLALAFTGLGESDDTAQRAQSIATIGRDGTIERVG